MNYTEAGRWKGAVQLEGGGKICCSVGGSWEPYRRRVVERYCTHNWSEVERYCSVGGRREDAVQYSRREVKRTVQ